MSSPVSHNTHSIIQWVVGSAFIMCIGLSMAELASVAPTSGGVCLISSLLQRQYLTTVSAILLDLFTCLPSISQFSLVDCRM